MQKELDSGNGVFLKSATIKSENITPDELKAINKYTLEPLNANDVFIFKLVMCDNDIDRDFESFSLKALQQLQKLFKGKTLIKDHRMSADNQVARIYSTELVQEGVKTTQNGELYTQLVGKAYMVKTDSNAPLIREIKAGIKKEVSISCAIGSCICSICGTDNRKHYCSHYRGREYEKDGKKSICSFTLDNALDAYEVSLVAVPAQRNAGACKNYGTEPLYEKSVPPNVEIVDTETLNKDSEIVECQCDIAAAESFILSKKETA